MGNITHDGAAAASPSSTTTDNEIPRRILRALSKPFAPNQVRWRLGNGAKVREGQPPPEKASALAYIDARDCHNRLDSVLGLNWECSYAELRQGKIIVCTITIFVDGRAISRSNGADSTDIEPDMGAMSVAFRRAATMFGIGRDLYGYPSPWVKVKAKGKSLVIEPSELPNLKKVVADKCAEWEAREEKRKAAAPSATPKAKPPGPPPAAEAPVEPAAAAPAYAPVGADSTTVTAPADPSEEETRASQLRAIRQAWVERMTQATTADALKAIAAEIGKGPFAKGSPERNDLHATYAKEMVRIDPTWKPTGRRVS